MRPTTRRVAAPARPSARLPLLREEYEGARLGDVRRSRRLLSLAERLERRPGASFPQACRGEAELEGCYRLLSNEGVQWRDILAPHVQQSLQRCAQEARAGRALVVAHDTTSVRFVGSQAGVREGVGSLSRGEVGFEAHLALGCSLPAATSALAYPQGVLGLHPHVRPARKRGRPLQQQKRESAARARGERESEMWETLALAVQRQCEAAGCPDVVHVMDREADSFRLLYDLQRGGCTFVIRGRFDRLLEVPEQAWGEEGKPTIAAALLRAPVQLTRQVAVPPKKAHYRGRDKGRKSKKVPARPGRTAHLEVRALPDVRLKVGRYAQRDSDVPPTLTLNAVEVLEPAPPQGQEAMRWLLWTSLPVDTPQAVAHVVDCYRARWSVEEYFKALKTGCALEKRQLMSLRALLNALALLIPLAWRLFALRNLAHEAPTTPASRLLAHDELALLGHLVRDVKLSRTPTCDEALRAIASLGGHLKRNGPPGWQTLGRGLEQLLAALDGFRAAQALLNM